MSSRLTYPTRHGETDYYQRPATPERKIRSRCKKCRHYPFAIIFCAFSIWSAGPFNENTHFDFADFFAETSTSLSPAFRKVARSFFRYNPITCLSASLPSKLELTVTFSMPRGLVYAALHGQGLRRELAANLGGAASRPDKPLDVLSWGDYGLGPCGSISGPLVEGHGL